MDSVYGVQKKIIAIHSEDRDIVKWPTPTQFEIDLPVDYKNVVSIRLNDIDMCSFHLFMEVNQNTKFRVELGDFIYFGHISEGSYTADQMANELTGQLNACTHTTGFLVVYNQVSKRLVFTNTAAFCFSFCEGEEYCGCATVFYDNYSKWGLGSYLGFEKTKYVSELGDVVLHWKPQILSGVHFISAPFQLDLVGDTQMYMELATYNNIDELMPYAERSNDLYFGKFGGKHNSSFAKIPLYRMSNVNDFLTNIFFSVPPLERVQKLRFKFRFHDGRPVEFNGLNFNFSLEITTLRNEMPKNVMMNRTNYTLT
jgi:hypothetical protein